MNFVKERLGTPTTAGLIIMMVAVLIGIIVVSVAIGTVKLPYSDVFCVLLHNIVGIQFGDPAILQSGNPTYEIVWNVRTPRVIMAAIVGVALALAGVVMQATVQNPLADPYILGMSSGASLGATVAIATGAVGILGSAFSQYGIAIFAFIGSILASFAVLALSSAGGRMTSVKLVLSGTIIASLFGAFSNMVITLAANAEEIQSITFWLLGSFNNMSWPKIWLPLAIVTICIVYFLTQIRPLNTMLMGEDTAITLGLDLAKKRKIYVLMTALLTATAVCFCGIIGFVGLMIPHIVRGLTGNNHWKLLPISCLLGGIFLVFADLLARTLISGTEIPIGIITAFCGAPVFAYIMIKKTYSFS